MAEEHAATDKKDLIIILTEVKEIKFVGFVHPRDLTTSAPLIKLQKACEVKFVPEGIQMAHANTFGARDNAGRLIDRFYEKDIYIPCGIALIYIVREGSALWNTYHQAIGSQIQVHKTMPPGMPPEPTSVH